MAGGEPPAVRSTLVNSMSRFGLQAQYLRLGVDFDFSDELSLGIDEVFMEVDYDEVLFNTERSISFSQQTTSAYFKQQFGNYVALRGTVNLFFKTFKTHFGSEDDNKKSTKYSGSMAIDFML
jgi:hypothetical protein